MSGAGALVRGAEVSVHGGDRRGRGEDRRGPNPARSPTSQRRALASVREPTDSAESPRPAPLSPPLPPRGPAGRGHPPGRDSSAPLSSPPLPLYATPVAKHIGIVAVSPEGAALFYRQVFRQASHLLEPHLHPKVSLHNEPLAQYIDAVRANDWHAVGELLRRSAEILFRCGAEFCLSPDNAVQHGIQLAESGSPIPWLTMPELVARAVESDHRKVVGLIGTRMVTTGSVYQTHLGLRGVQVLVPEPQEAEEMDRIIFSELIYGDIRPESQVTVLRIIDNLAQRGCEGVILGSSEAPLVVTQENSTIPVYDAADLLARGALLRSIEP